MATTNCLNFGNPEKAPIMGQFSAAIDGLAEACTELETPITGGNVSFYNETFGEGIFPTPVIGIVGILDDVDTSTGGSFVNGGRELLLIGAAPASGGQAATEFGSSEYAANVLGKMWGAPPALDLKKEKALQALLLEINEQKLAEAIKDISEGGLAVTVAEMTFRNGVGSTVDVAPCGAPAVCALFGEDASRVLVSCEAANTEKIKALAKAAGLIAEKIGVTGGSAVKIAVGGKMFINASATELCAAWAGALQAALKTDPELVHA